MNQGSIEAIQTIICLNIYLNNNDKAPVARSMLGIAIRMASTMGLSVREALDRPRTDMVSAYQMRVS